MTLPIRNSRVRISQGTVFWREVGYGTTVLLLHGAWQDSSQWLPLMAILGTEFHCLAPDLLGFGESSRLPRQSYSIDQEVACLHEYLTQLRLLPTVLVADSLGAWVALRYALQHPQQVKGVIITAPDGLSHPQLDQAHRQDRWLARPWALRYWLGQGWARVWRSRDRGWRQLQQRRRQLRQHPAACRLLWQRRAAAVRAEQLNGVLPQLDIPLFVLHPEAASPTAALANNLVQSLVYQAHGVEVPGDELTVWEVAADRLPAVVRACLSGAIAPS